MVFDGFFWRRAGHGNGAKRMPKPENEFPEVGFEWILFFGVALQTLIWHPTS
jgi:hypothetical protein